MDSKKKRKLDIPVEEIGRIGNRALLAAYQVHEELGSKGEEVIEINQFGETALRMDFEAEESVIKTLRENKLPIRIVSEEHGDVDLVDDPCYLGILDGLDGSDQYKKGRGKNRYGTMFGIYKGIEPKYENYLYGGVMEHSAKKLYYGLKRKGSWKLTDGQQIQLYTSSKKNDAGKIKLYADTYFDEKYGTSYVKDITNKLPNYKIDCLMSSAVHYADLAAGMVEGVIECTRKRNLEIAAAFSLVSEAGGAMMTLDRENLSTQSYLKFGQSDHIVIVSACNFSFANCLLKLIR